MKHVSEELARFSGGRICPGNDDRRSGCISATPSASSIDDPHFVSPPPGPSIHSPIHSRGDHRRTESTSQQRLPRCINTQPTCPPNRITLTSVIQYKDHNVKPNSLNS